MNTINCSNIELPITDLEAHTLDAQPTEFCLQTKDGALILRADFDRDNVKEGCMPPFVEDRCEWLAASKEQASAIYSYLDDRINEGSTDFGRVRIHYPERAEGGQIYDYTVFTPVLKNYTPHDVHIYKADGKIKTLASIPHPKGELYCRCEEITVSKRSLGDVDLKSTRYNLDEASLPPRNGVFFEAWIVSNITEAKAYSKDNVRLFRGVQFVYPGDILRDASGRITGCASLADTRIGAVPGIEAAPKSAVIKNTTIEVEVTEE